MTTFNPGIRIDDVAWTSVNTAVGYVLKPVASALITSNSPIYTDATLTVLATNPFNADVNGNFGFWGTPNTSYVVTISGAGLNPYTKTYVTSSPNSSIILAEINLTAQGANIGNTTLYTVPTSSPGTYRMSGSSGVSRAATSSSTLPNINALWTPAEGGSIQSFTFIGSSSGNTLGLVGYTTGVVPIGSVSFHPAVGTVIQYSTGGYATSGATSMQYGFTLRLEYLGA